MKPDDKCVIETNHINTTIGSKLKLLRELAGLSQRELAKRAGMTNSSVSTIEQGFVSPSVQSLERILAALPMSLPDFFSFHAFGMTDSDSAANPCDATPTNLPSFFAGQLIIPALSSGSFKLAPCAASLAVLSGSLQLISSQQPLLLVQGDVARLQAGQLFRCLNSSMQDTQLHFCAQSEFSLL